MPEILQSIVDILEFDYSDYDSDYDSDENDDVENDDVEDYNGYDNNGIDFYNEMVEIYGDYETYLYYDNKI